MSYGIAYMGGPRDGGFDLIVNLDEPVVSMDVPMHDGCRYRYVLGELKPYCQDGKTTMFWEYHCTGVSKNDSPVGPVSPV